MKSSFCRRMWVAVFVLLLAPIGIKSQVDAQVSSDGLLIEYRYETSGGIGVTDGASAAGQIDDTGPLPSIHAIGSSGGDGFGLHYDDDVPIGIGSAFSLNFPSPESADDIVQIPMTDGDALSSITEGDFRVETWFKTTDTGRSNLFSSYAGPVTALNLELHTNNRGRIYVQGDAGTTDLNLELPTDSRDGQWHHLAGVRDGDLVELYYDGELVGSSPDVALSYTINKPEFYLGMDGRANGPPRFQGGLDDVRVYNSADTSSLVAEYLFETIEGVPVSNGQSVSDQVDETANVGPFHGEVPRRTDFSAPQYVADVPDAIRGHSTYSFAVDEQGNSVEDGRVTLTSELADVTQGDFAVESWFKTTDEGRSILFGGWPGDTVNLELHTDNRVRIYVDGPEVTDLNVTADIDTRDGEWHHLIGQREDDLVSIYLDGEWQLDMFDVAGPYTMEVDMFLGRDSRTGDTRFDGQLDNTRFWSRALSEAEIGELAAGAMVGTSGGELQAGDADQDLDFDQLDLVTVQIAAKYLTGQAATWGEGDWNGAPGGSVGDPPAGDGAFNQLDIIAALNAGLYLTGPYAALRPGGASGDDQTSIGYDPGTGEVFVDAPSGTELTSINIDSAGSIFFGDTAQSLGGSFDNDTDANIFKATFGGSFGSLSFGNVVQTGLSEEFVLNDLSVVGSLAGGGDLGDVDLIYVPEPGTALLLGMALVMVLAGARSRRK